MIDTCQAASMYEKFYSPNILAVGSSLVGEDSLSVRPMFSAQLFAKENYFSIMLIQQLVFTSLIDTPIMLLNFWKKSRLTARKLWENLYVYLFFTSHRFEIVILAESLSETSMHFNSRNTQRFIQKRPLYGSHHGFLWISKTS